MAFANRYLAAMADVYDELAKSPSPEVQLAAIRGKLIAGSGAIGCAVDTNPLVGLVDMAALVRLSRGVAEQPASFQAFGSEGGGKLVATLKKQEEDVWSVAATYLTEEQLSILRRACEQWLQEHPNQRYAMNVDLTEFAKSRRSGSNGNAAGQLVSGMFGLITLDPFTGLDPAVKEVEQTRVLAERMFFYLRHMPMLLAWQTDSLYLQLMDAPASKQVLANTDAVASSTTRFSNATSRFADSIEQFRKDIPERQQVLVGQLNDAMSVQRDAILKQATTQLSVQQDAMTKNLQGVTDASIDRLYARSRSLVLITVGAILGAMLLYRFLMRRAAPQTGN